MMWLRWIGMAGLLWLVVGTGCSKEAEPISIPLNQIWGYAIPGTQDIHDLEPDHFGPDVRQLPGQEQEDLFESSLWHQTYTAIDRRSEKEQPIGSGFAVAGTGRDALVLVKEIMEQDQTPSQAFLTGTECFASVGR